MLLGPAEGTLFAGWISGEAAHWPISFNSAVSTAAIAMAYLGIAMFWSDYIRRRAEVLELLLVKEEEEEERGAYEVERLRREQTAESDVPGVEPYGRLRNGARGEEAKERMHAGIVGALRTPVPHDQERFGDYIECMPTSLEREKLSASTATAATTMSSNLAIPCSGEMSRANTREGAASLSPTLVDGLPIVKVESPEDGSNLEAGRSIDEEKATDHSEYESG